MALSSALSTKTVFAKFAISVFTSTHLDASNFKPMGQRIATAANFPQAKSKNQILLDDGSYFCFWDKKANV